jgi:hypothetical protein
VGTSRKAEIKLPEDALAWARLAAYIDGEGHIEIRSVNGGMSAGSMMLSIGNTDLRLSVWLEETFGGVVRLKKTSGARKRFWEWRVWGRDSALLLERCLPYFIMKRDQAEIAISYSKLILPEYRRDVSIASKPFLPQMTPQLRQDRAKLMVELRESRNSFTERLA